LLVQGPSVFFMYSLQDYDCEDTNLDESCIEDRSHISPEGQVISEEAKKILAEAIKSLPQKSAIVISLYYYEEMTMKEMGKVFSLTESGVCQIHVQALLRLFQFISHRIKSSEIQIYEEQVADKANLVEREQKEISVSHAEKPGEGTETTKAVAEFPDASAKLTKAEKCRLKRVKQADGKVAESHDLGQRFTEMVRKLQSETLLPWLEGATNSGIGALKQFAKGIKQDLAAVTNALSLSWSNGQTEGQVNRLKLIKRQMYGRASFALLRKRVVGFLLLMVLTSNGFAEVRIAIIDSGCNIKHEKGISFVDDTIRDPNGHGTNVAKIIKEIAPDAKLYIAKVFTQDKRNREIQPFVDAIDWAISQEVDLINLSFGTHNDEEIVHNAIKRAYDRGILIVAAAGNEGELLDLLVQELSKRGKGNNVSRGITYPAKYDEVIAIGAIKSFWCFNRHVEYSPVGQEIEFVCNGSLASQKGTSFAAARASAIIAKIKKAHPNLKGRQLRETVRLYINDLGKLGRDKKFGYGKLEYKPM